MTTLALVAPLSGPLVPIEDVPDAVFAQRIVGDGVSIDPVTSSLVAPCDAEVLSVHPSGHALTLRTAEGVELVIHIGLETVGLRGEGFLPRTRAGESVRAGDVLIDFAADYVATHAASLLTQLVVTNVDRVAHLAARSSGYVEAGRDVVLELTLDVHDNAEAAPSAAGKELTSPELLVTHPTGLHARPAALVAAAARRFTSDLRLRRGSREANAKSVTGIMTLEIAAGDRIVLAARGADAAAALETLVPLITAGLHEVTEPSAAAPTPGPAYSVPGSAAAAETDLSASGLVLHGLGVSPGIAIGRVCSCGPQEVPTLQAAGTPEEEREKLERALSQARQQLQALSDPATAESLVQSDIFRAHLELLEDPDLVEFCWERIASGAAATAAWHRAFVRLADRLASAQSGMFAERAADVRDVGRRVLRLLAGVNGAAPVLPEDAVVVAHDLSPSETATLDRTRVRGLCTVTGGKTSHAAILARSLGIPAIAAIDTRALEIPQGTEVLLDGERGTLLVEPGAAAIARARSAAASMIARSREHAAAARDAAVTLDGHRIDVAANIGGPGEAADAVAAGADGVGLLRSEFLFMGSASPPTEEQQFEAYAGVAKTFTTGAIVIRTLDVGGDKPLPYLPLPKEDNPFLGIRGIRLAATNEDLLRTQLRAIVRASAFGHVHVMFPMISTVEDWRFARRLLEEERAALGAAPIPAGIMVEVPSAALMADAFASEADFFSVGTNDLTQYTLAMDRGHPALAAQVDALHPSVLRLIDRTARAGRAHGKWTGICGASAGEEEAVAILIGLGVTELSVAVPVLPAIKAKVRSLRLSECQALAARALSVATAAEVRALARL